MGGYFSADLIDRVRDAVDIVDLISQYVPLKRTGRDYSALCPFHEEKEPSFFVIPDKQIFYCFGCHQGGDVFRFLVAHDRLTFPEAVRTLADRTGIAIQESPSAEAYTNELTEIRRLNLAACRNYQKWLASDQAKAARAFLTERGISPQTVDKFKLGYSPPTGKALAELASSRGVPSQSLVKAGLATAYEPAGLRDLFRDRLMFPITDAQGRIVAFGGRTLSDATPKYLNSPETPLFSKRKCLFGLDNARTDTLKSRHVIVVEGYTDCITAHQAGICNVVATLGTALTPEHAKTLRRYADRITLVYDADQPGKNAAERALEVLLAEEVEARVVLLPEGEDPCSFILANGAEKFLELLADAKEPIDFKLDIAAADPESHTVSGQARITDDLMQLVTCCPNPLTRELFIRRVAEKLGASRISLTRISERKQRRRKTGSQQTESPLRGKRLAAERQLVGALLANPLLVPRAIEEGVLEEWFSCPDCTEIARAIFASVEDVGIAEVRYVLARIRSDAAKQLAVKLEQLESRKPEQVEGFHGALRCMRSVIAHEKARKLRPDSSVPESPEEWNKWKEWWQQHPTRSRRQAATESPRKAQHPT